MGLLDDLAGVVDVLEAPVKVGTGVINGVKDAAGVVSSTIDGDYGQAVHDGRKLMGDAVDVAEGLSALGASTGTLPTAFPVAKNVLIAESPVLAAAQMAIEGLKLTTGSGTPCNGDEFRGSSELLNKAVDTLIDADPHVDRWDGTASQVYEATNGSHYSLASDVKVADEDIAGHLDTEADQVVRTRSALDTVSESLKNYDLATQWMNATGAGRVIKFGLDVAAAGSGLEAASATLAILVKNSLENASRIRSRIELYEAAAKDTSGNSMGGCDVFSIPDEQLPGNNASTPMPDPADGTIPPSRSLPGTKYTVPELEEPIPQPPARFQERPQ
jgi:hypothetical protein